jgi:hypothetical protein
MNCMVNLSIAIGLVAVVVLFATVLNALRRGLIEMNHKAIVLSAVLAIVSVIVMIIAIALSIPI